MAQETGGGDVARRGAEHVQTGPRGPPSWPEEGGGYSVPRCVAARRVWPRRCHQAPLHGGIGGRAGLRRLAIPRGCSIPASFHGPVPGSPQHPREHSRSFCRWNRVRVLGPGLPPPITAAPRPPSPASPPCLKSQAPLVVRPPHPAQTTHSVPLSPPLPIGPQTRSLLPALHSLYFFH